MLASVVAAAVSADCVESPCAELLVVVPDEEVSCVEVEEPLPCVEVVDVVLPGVQGSWVSLSCEEPSGIVVDFELSCER
jgi:hypothetical protein